MHAQTTHALATRQRTMNDLNMRLNGMEWNGADGPSPALADQSLFVLRRHLRVGICEAQADPERSYKLLVIDLENSLRPANQCLHSLQAA